MTSPSNTPEDVPATYGIYFAFYLLIIGCCSLPLNAMTIWTFIKVKRLRRDIHDLLLFNMSVADTMVFLCGYTMSIISGINQDWIFGHIGCQIYAFVCYTMTMVTFNSIVLLAACRYVIVCRPQQKFRLTNRKAKYCIILSTWMGSFVWTVSPLFGYGRYALEKTRITCSLDWSIKDNFDYYYNWASLVVCYVLQVSLMLFFYCQITLTAKRIAKTIHQGPADQLVADNFPSRRINFAAIKNTVMVMLAFIICWTPYAMITMLMLLEVEVPAMLFALPTLFAKASCFLNPFVYIFTNLRLRQCIFNATLRNWCDIPETYSSFLAMEQSNASNNFPQHRVGNGAVPRSRQ